MPHFLHQWTYKDPQVRAMVTRPQDREEVLRVAVEAFGGSLHSFFFCFGAYDGLCISEFPDSRTALACLMSVIGHGGVATVKTTPLIPADEARAAMLLAQQVVNPYELPDGAGSATREVVAGRA